MAHIWQALRSGDWLTSARARGYSLILLAIAAVAIVGWIALSDGLVDRNGKPIGTDFSSFYAAGSLALEGRAASAYDMAAHYIRERRLFGAVTAGSTRRTSSWSQPRWRCWPIRTRSGRA